MRAKLGLWAGTHCTGGDRAVGEARRGHKATPRMLGETREGPGGSVRESSAVGCGGQRFSPWPVLLTCFHHIPWHRQLRVFLTFVKVVAYLRTLCPNLP